MSSSRIAPFVLEPKFTPRPWGARHLAPLFDYAVSSDAEPIGEVWLTGEQCRARTGKCAGKQLRELCDQFGPDLVGTASHSTNRFPLLLKFLFTQERLSVQVHPDDRTAQATGEPCGKEECWYIVDAQAHTKIALGLRPGVQKPQFQNAIEQNRAEELLNWLDVHAGEMIYVAAGTVHTIGPGAIIFEVQQNSDMTYRLYDYGRPRELHLQKGLDALKEETGAGKVKTAALEDGAERLIATDHFVIDRYLLDETRTFRPKTGHSPQCLIALQGSSTIIGDGFEPLSFTRSEAAIIPACINEFVLEPSAPMQVLVCALP